MKLRADYFDSKQRRKLFDKLDVSAQSLWLNHGLDTLLEILDELQHKPSAKKMMKAFTEEYNRKEEK